MQATVRYVTPTGSGTGTASWANASNDLQLMINNSASGDTIWVASGTYFPNKSSNVLSINPQNNAFVLKANVKIFGGFPNNGMATWTQRNWNTNSTILSGNNYYYHVVVSAGNVGTACLDGFTIMGGNAFSNGNITVNGCAVYDRFGSGVYNISSSPTLVNLIITGNKAERGGGMYNEYSSPSLANVTIIENNTTYGAGMFNHYSSPVLTNVIINGNSASSTSGASIGGGMNNWHSSPILTNVVIKGNSAGSTGGGIYNEGNSSPTLTNVLISGNSAGSSGGGMYNTFSSSPMLTNVTISGNSAGTTGGGIRNDSNSSPTIRNSIIWGNTAGINSGNSVYNTMSSFPVFYYSLVQSQNGAMGGGWDATLGISGGNNLPTNDNPLFVSPMLASLAPDTAGNYRLSANSPAIDKGNDAYLINITTDLDGYPRNSGCGLDLGPYEIQNTVTIATMNHSMTSTICQGDTATITFSLGGTPPWQLVYTKDYSMSFDTIKFTIKNPYWKVSPSSSTTYKFIEIADYNCVLSINSNIKVDVFPYTTVANVLTNDTLCHGATTKSISFFGDADMYAWWSSDTVHNIPTDTMIENFSQYTVLNNTSSILTTKITVVPKYIYHGSDMCDGKDTSFFITVLPNPIISNIFASDTLCDGEKTKPIIFSGVATSFEWNANGDVISGIPTGIQIGDFGEYIVENKGNKMRTSFFILKAKYTNGKKTCSETDTFSITVFPDPALTNILTDDTLCSDEQTKAIDFSGNANHYEWTATGNVSGLPIGLQIGNFDEYIVENKNNTLSTSRIVIDPKYIENGKICAGKDTSFSISVYSEPMLTDVLQDDTLCDGEQTKTIKFDGNASRYEWTTNGDISGIPAKGTNNFGAYTVTNKTSANIKSVISVIPKHLIEKKECVGESQEFYIVVNPAVKIESVVANSLLLCEGNELRIEANIIGENLEYQWYNDGNVLQGEKNKDFVVPSVSHANSGKYYVEVLSTCGNAKSQNITVNADGEDVLVEKWHDVILVDNSSERFSGYQWYRNGRIIDKATNQFYQEIGGLNGCYSVELRLASGGRTRSCERCAYKTSKSGEISVYPNPTTGQLTINNEQLTIKNVEIFDVVGKKQQAECRMQNGEIEIDLSHLANGLYFLKVDGKMFKIIKQ